MQPRMQAGMYGTMEVLQDTQYAMNRGWFDKSRCEWWPCWSECGWAPILQRPLYDNLTLKGKENDFKQSGAVVKFETFIGPRK